MNIWTVMVKDCSAVVEMRTFSTEKGAEDFTLYMKYIYGDDADIVTDEQTVDTPILPSDEDIVAEMSPENALVLPRFVKVAWIESWGGIEGDWYQNQTDEQLNETIHRLNKGD